MAARTMRGIGQLKGEMLARHGRHGDTMLVHISPEEAAWAAHAQGGWSINPATRLPEFFSFKKVLKGVAKAAGALVGGYLGGPAGAALGAGAASKLTGDSWGQAAATGLLSGLGTYGAQQSGLFGSGAGGFGAGTNLFGQTPVAAGSHGDMIGGAGASGGMFDFLRGDIGTGGLSLSKMLPIAGIGAAALAGSPKVQPVDSSAPAANADVYQGPDWSDYQPMDRDRQGYGGDYATYGQDPQTGEFLWYDNVNPQPVIKKKGGGRISGKPTREVINGIATLKFAEGGGPGSGSSGRSGGGQRGDGGGGGGPGGGGPGGGMGHDPGHGGANPGAQGGSKSTGPSGTTGPAGGGRMGRGPDDSGLDHSGGYGPGAVGNETGGGYGRNNTSKAVDVDAGSLLDNSGWGIGPSLATISKTPTHFGPNVRDANRSFAEGMANTPHETMGVNVDAPSSLSIDQSLGMGLNTLPGVTFTPNAVREVDPLTGKVTFHSVTNVDVPGAISGIGSMLGPLGPMFTLGGLVNRTLNGFGVYGPQITHISGMPGATGSPGTSPDSVGPESGGGSGATKAPSLLGKMRSNGNAALAAVTGNPNPVNPANVDYSSVDPRYSRKYLGYGGDYGTYGQDEGENQFWSPMVYAADGGEIAGIGGAQGNQQPYHEGPVRGAGGGQDDLINARLADGEHVLDADIVSGIGDGSNEEGHRKLEAFKAKLRQQKRKAPVDKIPPKTKNLDSYFPKKKVA